MDNFLTKGDDKVVVALKRTVLCQPKKKSVKRRQIPPAVQLEIAKYCRDHGTFFSLLTNTATCLSTGYRKTQIQYGPQCPPRSTLAGWVAKAGVPVPEVTGRPRLLTNLEERKVYETVAALRRDGACIDAEDRLFLGLLRPTKAWHEV